jgi:hypothetical protein
MIQSPTDARTAQSEPHAAPQTDPTNPVRALQTFGQSAWLDYLRRSLFTTGEFKRLIGEDGLRGVTSNPSIFEKAIAGSTDYLSALQDIERRGDLEPMALYEALAIRDIRDAADLLRPVYDSTERADGYVSLEVSPYLAHDTQATIDEARRLWKAVARDNVMIVARTHIGYGSPHKHDTWHAHGEPLGREEVRLTKRALGWPDRTFYVPDEALRQFRDAVERGAELEARWRHRVDAYRSIIPTRHASSRASWRVSFRAIGRRHCRSSLVTPERRRRAMPVAWR